MIDAAPAPAGRCTGTHPALYEVTIAHARRAPVTNTFCYRSYMWLFDPDRPPRPGRLLGALAGYQPADHLDVRAELAAAGIEADHLLVLTNLRVLGYVFNPISIYWCYARGGRLVAHVAEVHNTYGGRHAYVLPAGGAAAHSVPKAMYVSPFYPVDGTYRIAISDPGPAVSVAVVLERPGDEPFRARMSGRRVPVSAASLIRRAARFPAAPLRGRLLIQYQGLRLWRRGVEVQPR